MVTLDAPADIEAQGVVYSRCGYRSAWSFHWVHRRRWPSLGNST
jgi:hypothetical protein